MCDRERERVRDREREREREKERDKRGDSFFQREGRCLKINVNTQLVQLFLKINTFH